MFEQVQVLGLPNGDGLLGGGLLGVGGGWLSLFLGQRWCKVNNIKCSLTKNQKKKHLPL